MGFKQRLARIELGALELAAIGSMGFIRVHLYRRLWPLGHHPRLLSFIGAVVGGVVMVIIVVIALIVLLGAAFPDKFDREDME